jgi:hypothetical protein
MAGPLGKYQINFTTVIHEEIRFTFHAVREILKKFQGKVKVVLVLN